MKTKIKPCICEHKYQDKLYGKGQRVWNWAPTQKPTERYRCSVCGNVKEWK